MSVGLYRNRGCEAIVRGTVEILRREFGDDTGIRLGVSGPKPEFDAQAAAEPDQGISSFSQPILGNRRWSADWFKQQFNRRLRTSFCPNLDILKGEAAGVSVALEVGGDHYSMDYGGPHYYLGLDAYLISLKLPVVLWGASVGPFDTDPRFARRMFAHLRRLAGVFVRETESLDYLRANGVVDNVHLVADPAFAMGPAEPAPEKLGFPMPEGCIGINLSPMIAHYRGRQRANADLSDWARSCAKLVQAASVFDRPILLVPHVTSSDSGNDDRLLLASVRAALGAETKAPILLVPRGLNAAELKWVISRCAVFAGARTHSTIAALSSCVPTLSIGYSLKSRGLNRDIYGHLDYCIHVSDLTPDSLAERLRAIMRRESEIRTVLQQRIPAFRARALSAGALLRECCAGRFN